MSVSSFCRPVPHVAQIDAVYATSRILSALSLFGGVLVAAVYWRADTSIVLSLWIAALAMLWVLRWTACDFYRSLKSLSASSWAQLAVALQLLAGVTWGLATMWLAQIGQGHQIVILCTVVLAAVSVTLAHVCYWPAHLAFHVPLLLLAALGFLLSPHQEGPYLAIATLAFCATLAIIGRRLGQSFLRTVEVAAQNEQLARNLSARSAELERANAALTRLSRTDALTGLANRRHFDEVLAAECARSARYGVQLSLLAIDVDRFKSYNDDHGHAAGDACLRLIAEILRDGVRMGSDFPARPGGEEFSVILPHTDPTAAATVAERIRDDVAAAFDTGRGDLRGPVTVSIGVADTSGKHPLAPEALSERADRALYLAKEQGRNRVCFSSGPPAVMKAPAGPDAFGSADQDRPPAALGSASDESSRRKPVAST